MKNSFLFGTVGSPLSTPAKPGGTIGAINQIHQLGLQTLELGWVRAVRISEEACASIKTTAKELDIAISIHAPYFINLNATDEEWNNSRKRLMDAAYYGYLAGATDIIFHPGCSFGAPLDVWKNKVIERLSGCANELKERDIFVTLRPETMGKQALIGSLQDTLMLSREVPGVAPCLDFAHLHARTGNGMMNSEEEWSNCIAEYQQALGDESLKGLHIHLSGIAYTEKGEKKHLPLEESDLNYKPLLKVLADHNCGGRILCESPIMEEDALLLQKAMNERQ
jgi:deoxyribonuclease-4